MAGRTDSRLSVDRGGDERAGFRSDGSAAVGARSFILCHRIWRAQRRSAARRCDSCAGHRPVRLPVSAIARRSAQFGVPVRCRSCIAGTGEGQPAKEQRPRLMGLWRRNATQSERGAGQVASRDARDAHFGRLEARKPRWCRPGFADRARTRTQGNRRVYLVDRVGGAKEDRALRRRQGQLQLVSAEGASGALRLGPAGHAAAPGAGARPGILGPRGIPESESAAA